jgi:arginyl-tRNA synthetase
LLKFPPLAKPKDVTEASIDLDVPNWTVIKNGLIILGVPAPEKM